MITIVLYIIFLPTAIIDYLNRKDGGMLGGELRPFFTGTISQALWMIFLTISIMTTIIR